MSINADLKFEDALQELERIVLELESGNVPLTKSVELYNRAKVLHKHCDKIIREVSLNIESVDLEGYQPRKEEE